MAQDISGASLSGIARSGWYVGTNIPEITAYGLTNAWYRIFANVQADNSKTFSFASNEGKMYMGWIDAGQSAFRLVKELPSKDDLDAVKINADNARFFRMEFNPDNNALVLRAHADNGDEIQLATSSTTISLMRKKAISGNWEVIWSK